MNLETTFRRNSRLTGDPVAAAILTYTEAVLGIQPQPALTAKEAATLLGVSIDSVYELCRSGKLRHRRVGRAVRIERIDLENFQGDNVSGGHVFQCLKAG
jgi:excisionase family DNA binding protein